jgi:uncharacterized protein
MRIQEIPELGRDLQASSKTDKWLEKVVRDAVSTEISDFEAIFTARISKFERTVELTGGVYLKLNVMCDSCTEDIVLEQQISLRVLLEPAKQTKGKETNYEDEVGGVSDTIDFSYYNGEDVDIGDIIRQHIVMAQPIRHLCGEECKGLCPTCGKNFNKEACECPKVKEDSPFVVLKQLKQD